MNHQKAQPAPRTSSRLPASAIFGIIASAVVALVVLSLALFLCWPCCRKRSATASPSAASTTEPTSSLERHDAQGHVIVEDHSPTSSTGEQRGHGSAVLASVSQGTPEERSRIAHTRRSYEGVVMEQKPKSMQPADSAYDYGGGGYYTSAAADAAGFDGEKVGHDKGFGNEEPSAFHPPPK